MLTRRLSIKQLSANLARLTGETRTEALRTALEERMARLSSAAAQQARRVEMTRIFGRRTRGMVPARGKKNALTPEEVQELLAYGP